MKPSITLDVTYTIPGADHMLFERHTQYVSRRPITILGLERKLRRLTGNPALHVISVRGFVDYR